MKVWVTIEVEAEDVREADAAYMVEIMHDHAYDDARLVDAQPAPPQGCTVIGDMHEDAL